MLVNKDQDSNHRVRLEFTGAAGNVQAVSGGVVWSRMRRRRMESVSGARAGWSRNRAARGATVRENAPPKTL